MALEDVDTMNAIRAALDSLPGGESILLYGEPWMGGGTNFEGGARPADKRVLDALHERIGFFCDDTRDCIKGNVFDAANAGYVNGAPQHGYDVLHSISAWRSGAHGFWPKRAGQVVQYVSAHDNYTLWDKLAAVGRRGDYDYPDADLLAQNRMTAGIYLTCQGLPFMQAGEEWGRTKHGDHNSYKGPLATNRLDWTRAHRLEFAALTAFYRGMLAIRRAYPRLSGAAGEPEPFILALPGLAHRLCAGERRHGHGGSAGRLLQPRAHPPVGQPARRYLAQIKRRRPRRCDTLRPLFPGCVGAGPDERDGAGGGVKV